MSVLFFDSKKKTTFTAYAKFIDFVRIDNKRLGLRSVVSKTDKQPTTEQTTGLAKIFAREEKEN